MDGGDLVTENRAFLRGHWDEDALVKDADQLLSELFPICRSITGEGVRKTLNRLGELSPLQMHSVPTGTGCYDWTIPDEWNISDAYIALEDGTRIVDFQSSNIHVVSYSEPIDRLLSWEELAPHLYTLPAMPEAIPYRTSYYQRSWGFCLSHRQWLAMDRSCLYRVRIDSTIRPGVLNYAEATVEGTSGSTFLISTYCCHPSLANDNLSGQVLWSLLLRELRRAPTRHTYRFVNVPETIGAIAFLSRNEAAMQEVDGCLVLTTVAGPGQWGVKRTFKGDHLLDRIVTQAFRARSVTPLDYPFDVFGSDEAQYSMPFFRIPCCTITKDKYYEYDEYHTSLDNLEFVNPLALVQSLDIYLDVIERLEMNTSYIGTELHCQPMLGRRGLYPNLGGAVRQRPAKGHQGDGYDLDAGHRLQSRTLDAMFWTLFWADGTATLLDIEEQTGIPMAALHSAATTLVQAGLLTKAEAK